MKASKEEKKKVI